MGVPGGRRGELTATESQGPEAGPDQPDVQSEPGGKWPKWLLSLYLNGLCPTFVVCFVLLAALVLADGGSGLVPIACLVAGVVATLFALVFSPFLGFWRGAMAKEKANRYLGISALLSAAMLLWAVMTLAMLAAGLPYLLARGLYMNPPSEELLPSLDLVLDGSGYGALALAWGCGWLVCALTRQAARQQPVSTFAGGGLWRKLLSVALLIPYLLAMGKAGLTLALGARLDPSLREAYQSELQLAAQQQGLSEVERLKSVLPPSFRDTKQVQTWLAGRPGVDRADLVKAWCRQAANLSPDKDAPALLALARVADLENITGYETGKVPPALTAELLVRSEVILLEWGGLDPTHTHRLYEMRLPAADWKRLRDLALARTDLARGASLTDQDVRDRFVDGATRVLSKSDFDMDGKLQRKIFQRCAERAQLNRLWRAYQAGKPYPEPATPLSPSQFEQRYAPSLSFDLRAIDEDITQATFREDLARQNLAYDIVLMELKRLEAEGAELPKSWDEFAPEVAAVAKPYAEWMVLTATPDGVTLRRREPRNGMSLTHRFGRSR